MERSKLVKSIIILFVLSGTLSSSAFGLVGGVSTCEENLKRAISKNFPGAEISIKGPIQWVKGTFDEELAFVNLFGDDSHGKMHFSVSDSKKSRYAEGWVSFSAWASVKIATKQISPGEMLKADFFNQQDVDLAVGDIRNLKGIVFPGSQDVQGLESNQTILENQFLTTAAVRKIPDVRRGTSVQVEISTGDMVVRTPGIVQEEGFFHQTIRVTAGKAKRELAGQLQPSGVVKVKL